MAGNKNPAFKAGSMCFGMSAAQEYPAARKARESVSESLCGRPHSLPDRALFFYLF
jgi:hypothetical protein